MAGLTKKLSIAASLAVGIGAIGTAPALAGSFTTSGSDYYLYCSNGSNTYLCDGDLNDILQGDASSPGGNIELFASSETLAGKTKFWSNEGVTSISGQVGSSTLSLSSLTAADWFGSSLNKSYGANTLATKWFNGLLTNAGQSWMVNSLVGKVAFNEFLSLGGFERTSDANISYINHSAGKVNIGLAGHYDLKYAYGNQFSFIPSGLQASEVVKYSYNGVTDYLYSFKATQSGQFDLADGKSHNGNYEVSVEAVPEPSTMLSLMAIGGLFAASKRKGLKNA